MKHLASLDQVAYIRFASVYHEFDDAQDFVSAISAMVKGDQSETVSAGADRPR